MKAKTISPEQYKQAEDALFKNLPPLEDDVERWVEDVVLSQSRYMFAYKTKLGNFGYCTHCKKDVELRYGERLRHNEVGTCPNCGSRVTFKDAGRGHKNLIDYGYIVVAQPLPDKGVVVRSFLVEHDFTKEYRDVETLYGETYRIYFNTGIDCAFKKVWNWGNPQWVKLSTIPDPQSSQPFYSSKKLASRYYGFEDENFKDTNLRYCEITKFKERGMSSTFFNAWLCSYLNMYIKYPVLTERLMKEGYREIVWERVYPYGEETPKINLRAKTVPKALGLNKAQVRDCAGMSWQEIEAYKFAQENNLKTEEELHYAQDKHTRQNLNSIKDIVSVKKAIKYIISQNESPSIYSDYIAECRIMNFNLKSEGVLFPQNLREAHDQNIDVLNERKDELEAQKKEELNEKFQKEYLKKWNDKYNFQNDDMLCRPAQSYLELLKEGRELHHCVGKLYSDKYLNGKTIILFIRRKSNPNAPFYTMELSTEETVIQVRGDHNRGKTPEVEQFVKDFSKQLNDRRIKELNKSVA